MNMKAVVQSAFGNAADVLALEDVTRLRPDTLGPTDVLVRVVAAGIAKGDWLITHGLPYIARPMYGIRTPKQRVAGQQFAGTVEAFGRDVSGVAVGDAVFGARAGAFAEFVAVPQNRLVAKPAGITYAQAAVVPISGIAAMQAVRQGLQDRQSPRVLVVGASGGVGSMAVQIAKARGAEVTGVASTANLSAVRDLGADHVIDYTRQDPTDGRPDYDVIIDIAGNRPVSRLRRALSPTGTLLIVGGTGSRWTMGFERTVGAMLLSRFVQHTLIGLISTPSPEDLSALADLMAQGQLTPAVRQIHPFSRAAEAIEAAGTNHGSMMALSWE